MEVEAVWIWGMPPGVGPGAGWRDRSPVQDHFSPILSHFPLFSLLFHSHRSRIFLPALGLRCTNSPWGTQGMMTPPEISPLS